MRQKALVLLFANGIILYVLIVARIHYVSSSLQERSRQQFPGVNETDLRAVHEVVHRRTSQEEKPMTQNHVQEKEKGHPDDTHTTNSVAVATRRDQAIDEARRRVKFFNNHPENVDSGTYPLEFQNDPHDGRPAFDEIVDKHGNVTQDVSDLLQFAVVGFGKCGTTTMMDWLSEHPQLKCWPEEVADMMRSRPDYLLAKMYSLPAGDDFQRGYKSPLDMTMPHIPQQLAKYFPKTKLIVGIRHPVRWFESLYNFRLQNYAGFDKEPFPSPSVMIGSCRGITKQTCTHKGEFAIHLRNLGVTPTIHASNDEIPSDLDPETLKMIQFEKLVHQAAKIKYQKVTPLPNPIFLFEMNQLHEQNSTHKERFQKDVSDFLGLDDRHLLSSNTPHSQPGKTWSDPRVQAEKDAGKIDICDDEHAELRRVLLRSARATAVWIRRVLLLPTAGRVRVSSPEHFDRLLEDWMHDPCGPHDRTRSAGEQFLRVLGVRVQDLQPPAPQTPAPLREEQ